MSMRLQCIASILSSQCYHGRVYFANIKSCAFTNPKTKQSTSNTLKTFCYLHELYTNKTKQNKHKHKQILCSSTYHWIFSFIPICVGICVGYLVLFMNDFIQFIILISIYSYCCLSLLLCEYMIRKNNNFNQSNQHAIMAQNIQLSSASDLTATAEIVSFGSFSIRTKDKQAVVAVACAMIAGCGYLNERLDIFATCMEIGYFLFHLFSSLAWCFWYWSLVGEEWTFKGKLIRSQQQQNIIQSPSDLASDISMSPTNTVTNIQSPTNTAISNTGVISISSIRRHIKNNSNANYYPNHLGGSLTPSQGMLSGHEVQSSASNNVVCAIELFQAGSNESDLYKTSSGRKRSFVE